MQEARLDGQQLAHAAVDVDAEDPQRLAAVRPAAQAGARLRIVQERAHRAEIADPHAGVAGRNRLHRDRQLVAEHARIGEERLAPGVGVQVGAADADAVDADEGLALGRARRRHVAQREAAGFDEDDLLHHTP